MSQEVSTILLMYIHSSYSCFFLPFVVLSSMNGEKYRCNGRKCCNIDRKKCWCCGRKKCNIDAIADTVAMLMPWYKKLQYWYKGRKSWNAVAKVERTAVLIQWQVNLLRNPLFQNKKSAYHFRLELLSMLQELNLASSS